ncbi:MAG: hypothetical protein R3D67_19090 [Hyphomicrobiaceae bacterium]
MTRRQKRLLVRVVLMAAVATLIFARYTSPRSTFKTTPINRQAPAERP